MKKPVSILTPNEYLVYILDLYRPYERRFLAWSNGYALGTKPIPFIVVVDAHPEFDGCSYHTYGGPPGTPDYFHEWPSNWHWRIFTEEDLKDQPVEA